MPSSIRTSTQSDCSNAPAASQSSEQSSMHKPFFWHVPQAENVLTAQFMARAKDVCHEMHSCLDLVKSSSLVRSSLDDGPDDDLPSLDPIDNKRLLPFAKASAKLLAGDLENHAQWMNKYA